MTKGKPWGTEMEQNLRAFVKEGKSVNEIAGVIGKTRSSVEAKMFDLGLKSLKEEDNYRGEQLSSSSSLQVPEELPSIEQELKVLSAALKALEQPGLDRNEILRLRGIIQGVKTYKELFGDYLNYRKLEDEVLKARRELASANNKEKSPATENGLAPK